MLERTKYLMKIGKLVRLPISDFWWSNKIGIVSEIRDGSFFNSEEWVQKEECKVEFGENFVWFTTQHLRSADV